MEEDLTFKECHVNHTVASLKISLIYLLTLTSKIQQMAEEYSRAIQSKCFKIRQNYQLYRVLVTPSSQASALTSLRLGVSVKRNHSGAVHVDVRITCDDNTLRPSALCLVHRAHALRRHPTWWPMEHLLQHRKPGSSSHSFDDDLREIKQCTEPPRVL